MMHRMFPGVAVAVLAAGAVSTAPAPIVAAGGFVAVSVRDVDASARWYQDKLGLTLTSQLPHQYQARVTILGGPGIIVELVQHDGAVDAGGDPALRHGLVKAGWIVDNFDSVVAHLRARQVDIAYGPFPARPNAPANVIIRDNEGNLLQLFGR